MKFPDIVEKAGATFTKSSLKQGREMHKIYRINERGNNAFKEFGKIPGIRPDFVDFNTKIIYEYKPNNPWSIRKGIKQLNRYKREFEARYPGDWTTVLDLY